MQAINQILPRLRYSNSSLIYLWLIVKKGGLVSLPFFFASPVKDSYSLPTSSLRVFTDCSGLDFLSATENFGFCVLMKAFPHCIAKATELKKRQNQIVECEVCR